MKINQSGQSLIAAMIAVAIVAAMALYLAKTSTMARKMARGTKNSIELTTDTAFISTVLIREEFCTAMLVGKTIDIEKPIPDPSEYSQIDDALLGINNSVVLERNKKIAGANYTPRSVNLIRKADGSGDYLRVMFELDKGDQSLGARTIIKFFKLLLIFEEVDTNKVLKCRSNEDETIGQSGKEVCEDMLNGVYNDDPQPGEDRCSDIPGQEVYYQEITVDGIKVQVLSASPGIIVQKKSKCGGYATMPACPSGYKQKTPRKCRLARHCGPFSRWRDCTRVCQRAEPDGYLVMADNAVPIPVDDDDNSTFAQRLSCTEVETGSERWTTTGTTCAVTAAESSMALCEKYEDVEGATMDPLNVICCFENYQLQGKPCKRL